jgi:hypothetical protein
MVFGPSVERYRCTGTMKSERCLYSAHHQVPILLLELASNGRFSFHFTFYLEGWVATIFDLSAWMMATVTSIGLA